MNTLILIISLIIGLISIIVGFLWFFLERPYRKSIEEIKLFGKQWKSAFMDPNSDKNELVLVLLRKLEQAKEDAFRLNSKI